MTDKEQLDKLAELRRQAEKRLGERSIPSMNVDTIEDAQRLIIELQVHQIELEMQNDELRRTQEQLEAERGKYADLYNFAPVAYFIFNDRDIILDLNLAAAELLGNERKYLAHHPLTAYITPEAIQNFVEHRQRALETKLPQTCELTIRRRDGTLVFVQARTIALHTDATGAQLWRSVMTDITERKRAENIMQARLRITEFAAEHSLADLLQNALDELCALSDSPIGFFHFVEPDQKTLSLQAWSTRTLEEMCAAEGKGHAYAIEQAGVWVDCVRQGRPVIHNDYVNLPASQRKGLPEGHAPVIREMVFPIMRKQKIVAIIGVGNKSLDYTEDDVAYASRLADLIWDITERKRAEIKLIEKEVQYRTLADSGVALIWTSGMDKLCNYFNEPWLNFTGRTLEQEMGNGWTEGVHPDDFDRCLQIYVASFDKHEHFDMEYRLRHVSGEYRWIRDMGTPSYNSAGEFIGYIGHCFDISEQKRAEDLLLDTQRRLEAQNAELRKLSTAIEQSGNTIVITDTNGSIQYANPRFVETTGYTVKEALGRNPRILKSGAQNEEYYRNMWETITRGKVWRGELHNKRKDGSLYWEAATIAPVLDDSGRVVNYIAIKEEITARKQAENLLRESENRLRLATRAGTIGVWDWNVVKNELIWDDSMYDLYGIHKEDFGGAYEAWASALHPDDREYAEAEIQAALRGEREYAPEFRIVRPDGSIRILKADSQTTRDVDGTPLRMIGTNMDITEHKQAEEEIRQLNATLEQRVEERTQELRDAQEKLVRQEKLAILGQMAGSVGHELRNPLGVISNSIYFLKMVQTDASDKIKEYHARIENNIRIADKIIADLLDFTRVKSAARESVSIPDLMRQTLERFPAPENIQVALDIPADLPRAYADPQHVIQVLGNLTLNACQAMRDGGKLAVFARAQAEMVRIVVKDTGSGISPEHKKKLFEPLFTTKAKGIGLGLAVCQKLIEANDGKIEVESELGTGSTFNVYLPVYKPPA